MNLQIPKDDALKILSKRKSEVDAVNFQPNVWIGKTKEDLKLIFGGTDSRWLQINMIPFTTAFSARKDIVLQSGKIEAKGFMDTYIEQIEDYSKIAGQKEQETEKVFQNKYYELQSEIKVVMGQLDDTIKIANENFELLNKKDSQMDTLHKIIEDLRNNTVQLTDLTLIKLLKLIGNLPLSQFIAFISIVISILVTAGWIGSQVEKNTNRSTEIKNESRLEILNKSNIVFKDSLLLLEKIIEKKNAIIKEFENNNNIKDSIE